MKEKTYPEVYVPSYFIELSKGNIKEPKKPLKPDKPYKIQRPNFSPKVYLYLLGGIIIVNFHVLIGLGLIGIFIAGVIMYFSDNAKFPEELKKYEKRNKDYQERLDYYHERLESYNDFITNQNNPTFIQAEKNRQIRIELMRTSIAKFKSQSKKGLLEQYFLGKLKAYFPDEIYTNMAIEHFKPKKVKFESFLVSHRGYEFYYQEVNPYTPDFIYKSSKTNMHIDIEIDEPYLIQSKEIIHAADEFFDIKRNRYFVEKGWFVIRFAEEQIIKTPGSCCYVIADLINEVTGDNSYIKKFKSNSKPTPVNKWKKNDIQMVKNKYRESYLKNFAQQ